MKLGIIGLPQSGKTTVFEALTKNISGTAHRGDDRISTILVPDSRIDLLSQMYQPRKTTYARVEYFLPGTGAAQKDHPKEQSVWTAARDCDALIHVIRNHTAMGIEKKLPQDDFIKMDQELILADLVVVEKRLERLELDNRRGKKMDPREHALLVECRESLENETPLRRLSELAFAPELRGYAFLSAASTASMPPLMLQALTSSLPTVKKRDEPQQAVRFTNDFIHGRLADIEFLQKLSGIFRGHLGQFLFQLAPDDQAILCAGDPVDIGQAVVLVIVVKQDQHRLGR